MIVKPVARLCNRKKFGGLPPKSFTFAVPMTLAGEIAFHLAKAGLEDFEVTNYKQDEVSVFKFRNEPEHHIAEEIILAQYADQIAAQKPGWELWAPQTEDPAVLKSEKDLERHHLMSSEKTADDPNNYMRGKKFVGPQRVPSRYTQTLERALSALETLAEIAPSIDIKECARMSALDLRQFADDVAKGKPRFANKVAGQWGERSYDNATVHDILDEYRHDGTEGTEVGFDDSVPEDKLPILLKQIDKTPVPNSNDDDCYLGVIVFLITHGSKVPRIYCDRAKNIAQMLLEDESYLQEWQNPQARQAELEKEIDILSSSMNKTALKLPEDLKYLTPSPISKGMTDAEAKKMEKYRRKKIVAWLNELGFLDEQGNGELLAEYDAGDFWKKDEMYEEMREAIKEERKFETRYRRMMRG